MRNTPRTPVRDPIFDPHSPVMQLRNPETAHLKMRGLLAVLNSQKLDGTLPGIEESVHGTRLCVYAFLPSAPQEEIKLSDDVTPDCTVTPERSAPLTGRGGHLYYPERNLQLSMQLADWNRRQKTDCRAYFLDGDLLARASLAAGAAPREYTPPTFKPGSPYFVHGDSPALVVPGGVTGTGGLRVEITDVQAELQKIFRMAAMTQFHVWRLISSMPEMSGVITSDGNVHLETDDFPSGPDPIVAADIRRLFVVALAIKE